jgi:ABC-type amino acid transport substrate-binding protein
MKKTIMLVSLMAVAALVLAACGGGAATADNLLDEIKNRGYILVSTDPNYEPQSFLNTDGSRPSDTKSARLTPSRPPKCRASMWM